MKHPQAMDVIKDSFGNYVAQRLVQRADVAERMAFSDTLLKPAMLELSGHQYGCRVIQAAIEVSHSSLPFSALHSLMITAHSAHKHVVHHSHQQCDTPVTVLPCAIWWLMCS